MDYLLYNCYIEKVMLGRFVWFVSADLRGVWRWKDASSVLGSCETRGGGTERTERVWVLVNRASKNASVCG